MTTQRREDPAKTAEWERDKQPGEATGQPECPTCGTSGPHLHGDLTDFEVGGTITTGVRLYHYGCEDWFAGWSSREQFPNVQALVDACESHECPQEAP